ncbi:MAG TPA: rhomboid family intramembrane serine protease [Pirellulaceae bacterium]|nr:rhomboid family intramembrane serine protease [Pirellulaceae bacterium]
MLIPYRTDAPIYHLPFATGGMIAANVLAFLVSVLTFASPPIVAPPIDPAEEALYSATGDSSEAMLEEFEQAKAKLGLDEVRDDVEDPETSVRWIETLMLSYSGIYPWQWVTSNFLHADFFHLAGNMIFLWTFSLVVEGKVGWWRYLLICATIGIGECAVEQTLMFLVGAKGGSLGASSIVFGLLMICLFWAPRNEFSVLLIIFFTVLKFDLAIPAFAGTYIVFETIGTAFGLMADGPSALATQALHLLGGVFGAAIGYGMLKARRVDCEGFDLLSIRAGREGQATLTVEQEQELAREQAEAAAERKRSNEEAVESIRRHLAAGRTPQALSRYRIALQAGTGFRPTAELLYTLIRAADAAKLPKEFRSLALAYLDLQDERSSENAVALRLKLAHQDIVIDERPRRGLTMLEPLANAALEPKHQDLRDKLMARAKRAIADGALEIPD